MKGKNDYSDEYQNLRQKAEQQLKIKSAKIKTPNNETETLKLLHELQVHQIELEMQNEELRIAKEKAVLAEEKYIELYDFAPCGYISLSPQCEITGINFSASAMLGKERSKLLKNRFNQLIASESKYVFELFFKKVFSDKEKQSCEIIISNDKNIQVFVFVEGVVSPDGESCFLTLTDITERKKAELQLQASNLLIEESENKFQQLVQNIDECFWLRNDHSMIYVSPGFEKIWGLPCQALYESPNIFTEKIHPEDKQSVLEILHSDKFKHSGVFDYNYRIIRDDGETRWINARSFPIKDNNGEIFRRAGIAIDITDKFQKHMELIKAKEHAEESDRLKSAFLANMSHEIRTPMNGILGFADLLKNPELNGEEQQEYIEIIQKSCIRMLNIINDIVDISKIEAGLIKVNLGESNINKQIEYIYNFFRNEAEAKGMMLTFHNSLPTEESIIFTDREKVFAILTNLIKNAIKFSNKGTIEFGYQKNADFLKFYVADEGIGIPKDRQETIFERFIQGDIANTRAVEGAGLGLAITKSYVEMLGGQIWVESEEKIGSTFYFTLPCKSKEENKNTSSDFTQNESSRAKKLKILIVEDDVTSAKLNSIYVNSFAQKIICVRSGQDAVEACLNNPDIDLILMDIEMPVMDGYQAASKIREFNKHVIIIAATAFAIAGAKDTAIGAGCNDYIAKPINSKSLSALIEKYFTK